MSETTAFTIGSEVICSDGSSGELKRVVINPVDGELTHLVVEPKAHEDKGRLVPVDLVESVEGEIQLRCSMSEFRALEEAEETHFIQGAPGQRGYGQDEMLSLPYVMGGMGMGGTGVGGMGMRGMGVGPVTTTEDRVPEGEVEVRRGERVHTTDGAIGRIHGFVIDPTDHHVTHVLLEEGHLWGKKQVAIPISAVTDVTDGVRINLTKDEVKELSPVDLDR